MPTSPLGRLLNRAQEPAEINPEETYKQVTVRLFHKGIVTRCEQPGSLISTRQWLVREGQVLLSRIDARNGAIGLVPAELDGSIVTNDFWPFDVDKEIAEPKYLDLYFGTRQFVEDCQRASEGTTNRVRVQPDRFLQIQVPLPSPTEQRRIVARIEELSAKIEEACHLKDRTTVELDSFFASTRATVFQKAAGSESLRLDQTCTLERGKFSHRPRNDPRFFGGLHPWIQIGEIESAKKRITRWSETLNDDGLAISRKFPKGTLLVSIAATIGAVGILDFDCCIPDSIVAITPKFGTDSEFIYHYLGYVRDHLEQIAPQSAQKNINLQILSPLPIPAVSREEQRRIVAYLDDLQAKVDSLKKLQQEAEAELNALMPSILSRAFAGEL